MPIMGETVTKLIHDVTDIGRSLDPIHWAILSGTVLAIGYFCLKGMNIR